MSGPDPEAFAGECASALADRYCIQRTIGRGGMSIVYLATDLKLDRPVAIKVLDPSVCSKVGAERFLREVRIVAPLQHPNILPLLDSGRVGEIVYSVMPYVEGDTVRDRLQRTGPLDTEAALRFAREIADALEYAHRCGVVHRDVKPENILLSGDQAVLADFGIARATNLANEQTLTGSGVPIGTPAYMSPEQVRGQDTADPRSDVYSLGVTLYEMLAGRPPFEGASVHETLAMHLEQEPPPLERRRPDLSDRVLRVVAMAMAKRAADRYQTAGDLAGALRELLGESPRQTTPVGPVPTVLPRRVPSDELAAPRRAGGWLVLAAVVLGLAALGVSKRGGRVPATAATPVRASLAVLPLTPAPGTTVPDYLAEGVIGAVAEHLGGVRQLQLAPLAASTALARAGIVPRRIGDSLDVAHVLAGTIAPADSGTYIVTLRLLRMPEGTVGWQRGFTFSEGSVATVAREIATLVGGDLVAGATIAAGHLEGAAPGVPDLVLQGRYWLARPSPDGLAAARRAFDAALALDSTAAEALLGKANAIHQGLIYGYPSRDDAYSELVLAARLVSRATARAPNDPGVLLGQARARHFLQHAMGPGTSAQLDTLARMYTRALAAQPNTPEVMIDLAHVLGMAGRREAALDLARRALRLDPVSSGVRHGAVTIALRVRDMPLALEWSQARLAQDPADPVALALEGYALVLADRPAECLAREATAWLAARALCLHAAGRTAEAAALADTMQAVLEREAYGTIHQFTDLATYHAWTGNGAEALRWIERAVARSPLLLDWIFTCGLFDRVANDPTFTTGRARIQQQVDDRLRARLAALPS